MSVKLIFQFGQFYTELELLKVDVGKMKLNDDDIQILYYSRGLIIQALDMENKNNPTNSRTSNFLRLNGSEIEGRMCFKTLV